MRNDEAIWITGLGTANPLGHAFDEVATNLLAGKSGVDLITDISLEDHASRIAGRVGAIPVPSGFSTEAFAQLAPLHQLVLWCATTALIDAGLWNERTSLRIGIVLGIGAEWPQAWERDGHRGGDWVLAPRGDEESLVSVVRRQLGLHGPAAALAAACASGNVALAQGRAWLRRGWVDVCLAGACDMWVTPLALASFGRLRVLSRRNEAPAQASRPFDRGRDGFVMGEGGALFVLEKAEHARYRSARVYGELAGYGATSDASNLVIPGDDPGPAATAVQAALIDAGIGTADVDYVNAHGTSTPVGDTCEARVLRAVLGADAPRVPVSSTKSMTGHLLSAAAAVEAVACLAAIERGAIPPTINLDEVDPDCTLCHVAHEAREQSVRVAIS